MSTETNEIKLKLATKLVDTLSIKESREEEFRSTINYVFSKMLGEESINNEEVNNIINSYLEEYSFSDVIELVIDIYASNFTEDELIDLINFFNTDTGKLWIRKYPNVMKDVMIATEKYSQTVAEKILKRFE